MDKQSKAKKPWYKRVWLWIGVIVLIFIIAGINGGDEPSTDSSSVTDTTTEAAEQPNQAPATEEKTEFAIGETASFNNKTITVTDVQRNYQTGNQFANPESGKEFVTVTVAITNNSNSDLSYNAYEFKMQDSNGVQQTESIMALSEGKLNSGTLAQGGTATGKLAYEVPAGDSGLKLLYQGIGFFTNKTVTFNLQ